MCIIRITKRTEDGYRSQRESYDGGPASLLGSATEKAWNVSFLLLLSSSTFFVTPAEWFPSSGDYKSPSHLNPLLHKTRLSGHMIPLSGSESFRGQRLNSEFCAIKLDYYNYIVPSL